MLVLSRHRDESIIIGDDVVVTVVDIRGDKVRIGISAPIEVGVHRQEIYEAIQREQQRASPSGFQAAPVAAARQRSVESALAAFLPPDEVARFLGTELPGSNGMTLARALALGRAREVREAVGKILAQAG